MQESTSSSSVAVTFVVWQGLTAIHPSRGQGVGGLEVYAWRLARSLAAQTDVPIDVSILVRCPSGLMGGKTSSQNVDGVRVYYYHDRREYIRRDVSDCIELSGGPKLKWFSPSLLWKVPYLAFTWPFRIADPEPMKVDSRLSDFHPDVWVTLGASREAAGVVATAIHRGKASLLMLQSNADLDARYVSDPAYRNPYGEIGAHCMFALAGATEVGCQTDTQSALLAKHFSREGVLVRNSIDPTPFRAAAQSPGGYVLWIGRYDRVHKRPHLAIEVAKQCPDVPFRMIVNESDEHVRREIVASKPANVQLIDYVPFDQQAKMFGGSRVFFSTGNADYEGFPTVLMESVAAGKPIVSLDDFDGFIVRSKSGAVVGNDAAAAARAIREYWTNPDSFDSSFATAYLDEHHHVRNVTKHLAQLLARLKTTSK